jgi:hypothetical protein
MSKQRIEQMLQNCLDGYEAGLTPEECLSAYPVERAALEPLLRQALSLRVAYATSPSDEFRHQVRERLMFAAGRDVKLALAREPDPNFILQERTRFLNVAGASVQEALRDVPPPRLPFWVNARRRLLDAASGPAPAPARSFGRALRYSMSVAVLSFALIVGALVVLDSNTAESPDAQLAALEQQITNIEERSSRGQAIEAGELEDLADRTSQITETIDEQDTEYAERIGGLIVRQKEVVAQQSSTDDLAETQQKLQEAEDKLGTTTASTDTDATPTVAAAVVEPTDEPVPTATESTPEPTPTPEPFAPGEVRVEVSDDVIYDLSWQAVSNGSVSFVMPDNWRLLVDEDEDGNLIQSGSYLALETDGEESLIVLLTQDGLTITRLNNQITLQLRGAGPDGETIPAETLVNNLGEIGLAMHHFVLSIRVTPTP